MKFHDVTIAGGELQSCRDHDTTALSPGEAAFIAAVSPRLQQQFENWPVPEHPQILLSWFPDASGTVLTTLFSWRPRVWHQPIPLTTCILLTGRDKAAEREAIQLLQNMIRLSVEDGSEPGYDLTSIKQRPVIACSVWASGMATPPDLTLVAGIEKCLAAAYFSGAS